MSDLKPCPACGSTALDIDQLKFEAYPHWYIRCKMCPSPCTVNYPKREDCVTKWNEMWCWKEIAKLMAEVKGVQDIGHELQVLSDKLVTAETTISALKTDHEKEIEAMKGRMKKLAEFRATVVPATANVDVEKLKQPASIVADGIDWKYRYDKIKDAYTRTRLEVSGSFGNWDYATRKRVLEHEISNEVGFII